MGRYQILWVDDDWDSTKAKEETELLARSLKKIEDKLGNIANDLDWKRCPTIDRAVVEIEELSNDFRIAIIDFKFKPDDSEFGVILKHIVSHNIPYIIYSYVLHSVEKHPGFKDEDTLRIGVIPKSSKGEIELADRVAAFFKAPPFRLLHLSDLHYEANATGNKGEEQKDLFDSLLKRLKEEHDKNKLDGITITGDFSSKKPETDLFEVTGFIHNLVNDTIGSHNIDRLFLVPGNHDLYWKDFDSKIISDKPWVWFLHFLQSIYNNQERILKFLNAWDRGKRVLNHEAASEDLLWNRKFFNPSINLIGFVTPSMNPNERGIGNFDKKQEDFVLYKWETKPAFGEVRIALMHHNLFATLSLSPYDEEYILKRSGNALYSLISRKCNIVLNGHTHSPNVYSLSVGNFNSTGYENAGQLIVSSTGNTSGRHSSGDRARCFNILEFMDADKNTGYRNLIVRPFIYESRCREWVPKNSCQFKITS